MKKILLIVDIQQSFVVNDMTAETARRIDRLVEQNIFDCTVSSKYINLPDNPIVRLMGWRSLMNEDEQRLLGRAGDSADFTVCKNRYSAVNPELLGYLKKVGGGSYPETVFLAGVDLECCVLATAIDLFELGIRPVVLSYYCGSSGGELYAASGILTLHHLIGKNNIFHGPVSSEADLLRALSDAENTSINDAVAENAETQVVNMLIQLGWRIAFAESCTGGLCAAQLVGVPDASKVFDASFVTYANEAKEKYLGVSPETIAKYGVVSEPVAAEMARGTAAANSAQVGVGISGIAGPSGGTRQKPVGTVCFGFYINGESYAVTRHFGNAGRNSVRRMSVEFVYSELMRRIADTKKQ